ncbi:ribonuclease III [Candidatus Falkowbacteria bacterium]|jgi:ribonuclease III|nr:ribonuclease III [Candidatus Falkowbacteria bacterium]MBT4433421.1 ribonuclease III [Candidatus Falkowbacteria bacterium]
MQKDFTKLEKILGVKFKEKDLLHQAFVHRSYLNENPKFKLGHNERLEFLGDAVLELAVTEYLFKKFPNEDEGRLTNLRASMVNTNMLAILSDELGLNNFLLLSKGESKDENKKARESILANVFEATLGAVYLDQGFKVAQKFLNKIFDKKIPYIVKEELYLDPKSRFQEISQEKCAVTPHYNVLKEEGPDHDKIFTIGVYIGEDLIAKAKGSSKQIAQVEAAKKGLKKKRWS